MLLRTATVLCAAVSALGSIAIRADAADFIENRGEWAPPVRYRADLPGLSVFCVDDGLVLVLEERDETVFPKGGDDLPRCGAVHRHALRIGFAGGESTRPVSGGECGAERSFLRGKEPARWVTHVRAFSEIVYPGAWPGIDLALSIQGDGVEYRIRPAARIDPGCARFRWEGGNGIERFGDGSFRVATTAGTLVARDAGPLRGRIEREGTGAHGRPLERADPSALRWSTFIGGSLEDYGYAIVVRPSGNIVIAGATRSADFPATIGSLADTLNGSYDAFAAEFDPTGSRLLWSTYIGGSGVDLAHAMALDGAGNLVLTGKTESPDFPVTRGTYDSTLGGSADAYALKLQASGEAILWSTYLGGSDYEIAFGLLVDPLQQVVVAGYTQSPDYPVTATGWDPSYNGGFDVFVTKLDPFGRALAWSTFLGGTNDDRLYHAAADPDGSVLITGWTQSPDFPVTRGAYDETYNGGSDAYVAKVSGGGNALLWSTFLGGSDIERAYGVATDGGGNPVVAGYVRSADFPTTAGAYDSTYGGNGDGFVASLDPMGSALAWSTFLGGTDEDRCHDLVLDADGDPVVTGSTLSVDFPTTVGTYDATYGGGGDAFGAALDPSGRSLLWGSFLGGGGWDMGDALASADARSILVCGETESVDFPVTAGAFDESSNGMIDAFVSKVAIRTASGTPDAIPRTADRTLVAGPNPFRTSANVYLDLPGRGGATVRVFDAAGAFVRLLAECGAAMGGPKAIVWDGLNSAGSPVASGLYFVRLDAGPVRRSVPLVRIR